jgi:hypothetical protein
VSSNVGFWRVLKIAGADVSGASSIKGTPRSTEIVVNSVTIPVNPGKQTVEYAISILPDANVLSLSWQSGTTFTGPFLEGVKYYVYARAAENELYYAGKAKVSAMFTIEIKTGMDTPAQAEVLKAVVQDGMLHVGGLTIGQSWSVYNISGALIYRSIATDNEAFTSLSARGVYIITSGKEKMKVVY